MTELRDEIGRMLLPFLDDSMTFAQSAQLADQLIRFVVEAKLADARTKFLDAMGETVEMDDLDEPSLEQRILMALGGLRDEMAPEDVSAVQRFAERLLR